MPEHHDDLDLEGVLFEPEGRWWTGQNAALDLVRGHLRPPDCVTLLDSTLREGEEAPGTFLTYERKLALAQALESAGLSELEVGYAGVIDEHTDLVARLKRAGIKARIASHNRCYGREGEWQEEIDRAIAAGCDILTFVAFGSAGMLRTTPWLSEEALPDRIAACVARCVDQGAVATFSLAGSDLFRTPLERIARCYRAAAAAGAERVYVSDGTGCATPQAVAFFTRFLRDCVGPAATIALHLHNTFGLSTANAMAGIGEGASAVDCSLLGMGDGAGITALEEIVLALQVLYGVETGVDPACLTPLCELAERLFEVKVSPHKPWVGANIFRHQIDSHIAAILRGGWHAWEVVRADVLGRERRLEFGYGKLRRGRSGAIALLIERAGLTASDTDLAEVRERIRRVTMEKRWATEQEVVDIIRSVIGGEG